MAGGIVQFEATEGNGDELAGKSGKIADGKNNENAAILAKNEIVDPPDRIVFVVYHRHQFKRVGAISFCDLRGLKRRKCDFLGCPMARPRRENDGGQNHRRQEREAGFVHDITIAFQGHAAPASVLR